MPENFKSENDDVTAGDIPDRHNVNSGHEDKNMNIRNSSEELCRPELRHVLGKKQGVEFLRRTVTRRRTPLQRIPASWTPGTPRSLFPTWKLFLSLPGEEKVGEGCQRGWRTGDIYQQLFFWEGAAILSYY